jgi:hypothetical protein
MLHLFAVPERLSLQTGSLDYWVDLYRAAGQAD